MSGKVRPCSRVDRRHRLDHRAGAARRRPGGDDVERRLRRHSPETAECPERSPSTWLGASRRVNSHRIVPAGDAALVIEFEDRIDRAISTRGAALADALGAENIAGVRDVVPTCRSVAVYFDPLQTDQRALVATLERLVARPVERQTSRRDAVRIPVCYGGDYGPDLPSVAAFAGLSEAGVIDLHASAVYHVLMLGFMPGFAYM